MPRFIVTWTMGFEAKDAVDAAKQALGVHRDPESIATVFNVREEGKRKAVDVDLTAEGELESVTPAR